jgi:hypothetical protein
MFYERRKNLGGAWAVIRLRAAILWKLDCAFCRTNAASKLIHHIDINKRKSVAALKAMFGDLPKGLRGKLYLPDRYTTDPQAEVLVLETIPTRYIESVYFESSPPTRGWKRKGGGHVIYTKVDRRVFEPRIDYEYWQRDKDHTADPTSPTVNY